MENLKLKGQGNETMDVMHIRNEPENCTEEEEASDIRQEENQNGADAILTFNAVFIKDEILSDDDWGNEWETNESIDMQQIERCENEGNSQINEKVKRRRELSKIRSRRYRRRRKEAALLLELEYCEQLHQIEQYKLERKRLLGKERCKRYRERKRLERKTVEKTYQASEEQIEERELAIKKCKNYTKRKSVAKKT